VARLPRRGALACYRETGAVGLDTYARVLAQLPLGAGIVVVATASYLGLFPYVRTVRELETGWATATRRFVRYAVFVVALLAVGGRFELLDEILRIGSPSRNYRCRRWFDRNSNTHGVDVRALSRYCGPGGLTPVGANRRP
jgi:hypothetical protein